MNSTILIIGLVWPEPTSSAAGTRMIQLIDSFIEQNYRVVFACAAAKSLHSYPLESKGVEEVDIQLNDHRFNEFVRELMPDIVMFDRFMVEEQYGWRVIEECPNALRILDTEDLHFLRYARQQAIKKNESFTNDLLYSDQAKREIAAILRVDLSLMISKEEVDLLVTQFKIDADLLYYLPFLENPITSENSKDWTAFDDRQHFVFIGNFLHEPNWNCAHYLKTTVWPMLRTKLPKAELHIYGAYAQQKVLQLHNKQERFIVKGRAEDARETISNYRVLLAPIQFGAGVKGKLIDAMQTGTPSVTTTLGAEAMSDGLLWNGFVEDDLDEFVDQSVDLYSHEPLWKEMQLNGIEIINQRYNRLIFSMDFTKRISFLRQHLEVHRRQNFMGQILNFNHNQSTKYLSLWIEEKNKKKE